MASIETNLSLNPQALALLHLLAGHDFDVESYRLRAAALYNGRERGVVLTVSGTVQKECLHIFWAESRRSDDLVVFIWRAEPAAVNPPTVGDIPESCLGHQERFQYADLRKARDCVVSAVEAYLRVDGRN